MSAFIRPEARAALSRWRDVLIADLVLGLGLWWVLTGSGLMVWLGYVLLLAGAALMVAGVQRARFWSGRGGPGVVRVDEGQIAYFGPVTGGAVALSEISRLTLDTTRRPAHWVLSQPGQPALAIPLNAEGAEALFDAFASLPGIRTERMLSEMKRTANEPVVIWSQPAARLH